MYTFLSSVFGGYRGFAILVSVMHSQVINNTWKLSNEMFMFDLEEDNERYV